MAFLILTEQGYRNLKQSTAGVPSPLWVNPGVLTGEDIRRLREEQVQVTVLTQAVDPQSREEIELAVQLIREAGAGTVWVERAFADESLESEVPELSSPEFVGSGMSVPASPKKSSKRRDVYGRTLHYIKRLAASHGPAMIVPHMSYGTASQLHVQGRVLESRVYGTPSHDHSAWSNIVGFYRQLGTDEVPGARLFARIGGIEHEIVADGNGYFHADLNRPLEMKTSGWQNVELELLHPAPRKGKKETATAQVLIPPPTARFGVISDIDDTVLWSNVGNKLRMLKMLALSNAHTRKPFKGVTAFYCALQQGAGGNENNPIFYVSSSPWNLYTSLVDFFEAQGIPLGPLALKELGFKSLFGKSRHHDHKLANIERILQTYPHLPFILIGDSGQHDPEIYKEIVERHPGRIMAIYIRNVNPDPARIEAIDRLIDEVQASDTQLLLVPDSEFAAMHAAGQGWIKADGLNTIRSDKRDDERLTNPKV